MAMARYRYTSERLLSDSDPRMLLLQWGLSSLGFCSVSSDNLFVFRYTYLPLVLTIDFLNFEGIPGPEVPGPGVLVPLLHHANAILPIYGSFSTCFSQVFLNISVQVSKKIFGMKLKFCTKNEVFH